MSRNIKPMVVTSRRATAMTYVLHVMEPLGTWATCTVNDSTGELIIAGDVGTWSHNWPTNPRSLGHDTLTEFLAGHSDVDYVARKLNYGRKDAQEVDPAATIKALCRVIAERRLRDGRMAIERWRDEVEAEPKSTYTLEDAEHELDMKQSSRFQWYGESAARGLVDAFREAVSGTRTLDSVYMAIELVISHHCAAEMFEDESIDELIQMRPSWPEMMLRESILPALFAACRETTISRMLIAANGPQPEPDWPEVVG